MRAYESVLEHWPTTWRRRFAVITVLVVFVLAALPLLTRVAGRAIDLGILPYVALVILCWVGEGGLLVPIPGVRILSWLTIVQQGANLDPAVVATLAAVAMACGQSSYFLVVRSGSRYVEEHLAVGPLRSYLPILVAAPTDPPVAAPADPPSVADQANEADLANEAEAMVDAEAATADDRPDGRLAGAASTIARRLRAYPRRTIFLVSVFPSPLTTLTTVGAATVGVPFRTFFIAAFAGFLVLSSVLAFAGQAILTLLGL